MLNHSSFSNHIYEFSSPSLLFSLSLFLHCHLCTYVHAFAAWIYAGGNKELTRINTDARSKPLNYCKCDSFYKKTALSSKSAKNWQLKKWFIIVQWVMRLLDRCRAAFSKCTYNTNTKPLRCLWCIVTNLECIHLQLNFTPICHMSCLFIRHTTPTYYVYIYTAELPSYDNFRHISYETGPLLLTFLA